MQGDVESVLISVNYDATPCTVAFGPLQDEVAPHARYFVKDPATRSGWRSIGLDEWKNVNHKSKPQRGVLELFAQTRQLAWVVRGRQPDREQFLKQSVILPPCFLANGRSSVIFHAVEVGEPQLDTVHMLDLAKKYLTFSFLKFLTGQVPT